MKQIKRLMVVCLLLASTPGYALFTPQDSIATKQEEPYTPSKKGPVYEKGSIEMPDSLKLSLQQLTDMGVEKAIEAIDQMQSPYEIKDLFGYNNGVKAFYLNPEMMNAVIHRLEAAGSTLNEKEIGKYTEILRGGFYRAFHREELDTLNTQTYQKKVLPALITIVSHPNFGWEHPQIIHSVGALIGSGIASVELIQTLTRTVAQFNAKREVFINDSAKVEAMLRLGNGIDYAIYTDIYTDYHHPDQSCFYNQINPYFKEVSKLALHGNEFTEHNVKLLVSCLGWIGRSTGQAVAKPQAADVLKESLTCYKRCSRPWIEAIRNLDERYEEQIKDLDRAQIKKEIEATLLPNWYYFEDSTMVFNTGDKVDPAKVRMLYWATKEVKAQFQRLIMRDTPIDGPGRKDDQLIAIVYNSPAEYEYNWMLNEVDTENGGIYIESWGKFFTWERTPDESIYTLEELFRHEYTHYLQCRYLCPGEWGSNEMYENDALTWVDEGGAEFQAGSTRTNGVLNRKVMLQKVADQPEERLTLDTLLNAGYSMGSKVYTYSYVLYRFMYEKHPEIMQELFKVVQSGKAEQFKHFISNLKSTNQLGEEFALFMDQLKKREETLTDRITSYDYDAGISPKEHSKLFKEITRFAGLKEVKVYKHCSDHFNTFELRGKVVLGKTQGEVADRLAMDKKADELLKQLTEKKWNGYKTLTAHFLNYEVKGNKCIFELVFKGYLPENIGHQPGI